MLRASTRRRIEPISRYPSVRRDLSLELDADVPAAAVRACVERTLGDATRVTSDYLTCIRGKALILIKKALP